MSHVFDIVVTYQVQAIDQRTDQGRRNVATEGDLLPRRPAKLVLDLRDSIDGGILN